VNFSRKANRSTIKVAAAPKIRTYDSAGNLDTSTDSRGAVSDYNYDAANRVTSVSFTLGGVTDQTITYGYDAGTNQNGRLTSASDADHTLAFTYDSHGRVTGKGQTVGGVTLAMGYGYDAAGRLGNVQLPSGNTVTFGYNANGQVSSLSLNGGTTILSGVTYDPFGPITGWTWGNGTTASRGFDTDGKITQVDNANGASLKNYSYDDAFRITGISDALDSSLSWTYGYDSLDQLSSASKTGLTQGWTYDANGNRLTETGSSPSTYTNSTTSNRLNSTSGTLARTYSYDNAGNTLGYGTATFTYNNRGRIKTASNAGTTATHTYNALGQRIRRATGSLTTLYVYDEAGHLAGEYTAAGALVQETVWLGDIPVATVRPNGAGGVDLYYVHTDHLNTPRLVTDTANNIRWRWDSDAFGTTSPNQNPSGLGTFEYNLRFPGQQYDAVVGLHYNYFRDYDPVVGRYVESDPIGLDGGVNTYSYTTNNSIMSSDPSGLIEYFTFFLNKKAISTLNCACGDKYSAFSGEGDAVNDPDAIAETDIGPIPLGTYWIVARKSGGRLGHLRDWLRYEATGNDASLWFTLIPAEGGKEDCKVVNGTVRCGFRLHPGSISKGCITLKSQNEFFHLRSRLMQTTPGIIPGTNTAYFGVVTVLQ
jgi:RHS repeat-associated protein